VGDQKVKFPIKEKDRGRGKLGTLGLSRCREEGGVSERENVGIGGEPG